MSKFIADDVYSMTNENGDMILSFVLKGYDKQSGMAALQELRQGEGKIECSVKHYKSKRSLEQNNLLWALLTKMAEGISGRGRSTSTEECYSAMLREANVECEYMLAEKKTEPRLREQFRVVEECGKREVNGKELTMYRVYIGSSKFNTKQMTELIECTLDRLAELGIYDSEIAIARDEYL